VNIDFSHVPTVLDEPHSLLEAPCVVPGGVAFSDVLAGGVFRLSDDDEVVPLLARRRGIGGMAAVQGGGLIVTGRDVSFLGVDGTLTTLHADPLATGFNDLAALPDGSVVVGVLRYRPLAGEPPVPGELVRLTPDGRVEVIAEDLLWPNGITVALDGALLVSDFARGHVTRIAPDGSMDVFCALADGSPDGNALDAEGALWVATGPAGSLLRVGDDGTVLAIIDVPARFVSSLCFAGPQLDELVVTTADNLESPDTGGTVLRATVPVPGAPVPLASRGA
jgi:gluconolactonase